MIIYFIISQCQFCDTTHYLYIRNSILGYHHKIKKIEQDFVIKRYLIVFNLGCEETWYERSER